MNALDLIYLGVAGVTAPRWARKARGGWPERWGRTPPLPESAGRPRLLLHAVSVGEVNALRTLVPLLAGEVDLVVSAMTDTGLARAREIFADRARVVRFPLDASWAQRRFLDAVRPDAVALVELELWPNFIRECGRRGIPVGVINGRLSERSFRGYRRIRWWMAPIFGALEFAAVQDDAYAERFRAMGVPEDRCLVTGSMKWDAASLDVDGEAADDLARALGLDRSRALVVAGSTGPGEEALLHEACPPEVQLLCAPRKPERFEEAAAALPGCVRRSAGPCGPGGRRFLLDTIGELRLAYSLADVVIVGRSFNDQFGSDPIEPIALGKPAIIGPAVSDFASIVAAFEGAGGIVRATRQTLGREIVGLLADRDRRERVAEAGLGCVRERRGASARHAELLLSLVRGGAGAGRGPNQLRA